MYAPIPNGTIEKVYDFTCHLPPLGYGVREVRNPDKSHTYTVEKTDIIKRSKKPEEQYWERTQLPENWNKLLAAERAQQAIDEDYTDPVLEAFRQQEWGRRLRGVWVYINGIATYITGLHYFYLNWWHIDGGYPRYRDIDRRVFYALQYCQEDPNCLGLMEVTGRRAGKTFRSGAWMYEYISRNMQVNGAVQSKTDDDGKAMYLKAIMTPWTKLPEFFRPTYNTDKGDKPEGGMFFFLPSKKGKRAFEDDGKKALESQMIFKDSKPLSLDGWALHRYVSDESGKLKLHDIVDRHDVVKPTCYEMGRIIGKHYYTTTVEDMEDGGGNFRRLWDNSDFKKKNDNGETVSGLYRIFTSAAEYEGKFDIYGFTNVFANETRIKIDRDSKKTQKEKYGAVRKYPLTAEEAMRFTGEGDCIFDSDLLNDRLDALELAGHMIEKGNLVWKDGIPDTEIEWVPNGNGKWTRCWKIENSTWAMVNNMEKRGQNWEPKNKIDFVIGCDPFSHNLVENEDKKSMAAAIAKMKHNPGSDDPMNDAFIMLYHARPAISVFHEDMVKMCFYLGCQILFENNKNNWEEYFKLRGYERCLMKLDQYEGYGVPGNDKNAETGVDMTDEYIKNSINKVFFSPMIHQWLQFKFHKRTKYDIAMAAMYTLMADRKNAIRHLRTGNNRPTAVESFYRPRAIINNA
jgi:hypothetical protein